MYKSKIFDVLNIKTEEKLIKNSIIKCDELNNISEHDIYVSIDLSRFTLYDTVSYAYYQLCILLTNGPVKFSLYETNDYEYSDNQTIIELNSNDVGEKENPDDVIYEDIITDAKVLSFDITKLINKKIRSKANKLSFRIYHDKTKNVIKDDSTDNDSIVYGLTQRLFNTTYQTYEMGNIGTSNISNSNRALRFDFLKLDSGNKIIPFAFSFSYNYLNSSTLLGDYLMPNTQYKITKTNNYILLTNYLNETQIYHYITSEEAFDYFDYECESNESYYSNGILYDYISLIQNSNNYTLNLVKGNIKYVFDYNGTESIISIKKIVKINSLDNDNLNDEMIFNYSNNLLTSISIGSIILYRFMYNSNNHIRRIHLPISNNLIYIGYEVYTNNNLSTYKTINKLQVFKTDNINDNLEEDNTSNDSNNTTYLKPYIDNTYEFSDFYGLYELKKVTDNYNDLSYEFTYTYSYNGEQNYYVEKILENGGINSTLDFVRSGDLLTITNQYGDIKKVYIDEYNNVTLTVENNKYTSSFYEIKDNSINTKPVINSKKSVSGKYNSVLQNGKFESIASDGTPSNWTLTNNSSDQIVSNTYLPDIIGPKVFKFTKDFINEKSLKQTYSSNGLPFEKWQFSLWYKGNLTSNHPINIIITLKTQTGNIDFPFYVNSLNDDYNIFSGSFETKSSYNSIELSINVSPLSDVYIGNVKLYKYADNNKYEVSTQNQVESFNVSGEEINYIYNEFGKPIRAVTNLGEIVDIEYDNKGNIIKVNEPSSIKKTEYNYDENNNNIETIQTYSNGKKLTKSYYYDEYKLLSSIDENYNMTEYIYDTKSLNLKQTLYNNGTLRNITYDTENNKILNNEIKYYTDIIENNNNTYSTDNLLETVETNEGTLYNFLYDNYKRLELVDINYYTLYEVLYSKINNKESNLISEQKYPYGDYRFTYDSKNRLEYIKFVKTTIIDYFKFTYDDYDRLIRLEDYINNIVKTFTYDENDNVNYITEAITNDTVLYNYKNYYYDNFNNLQKKNININNIKISYEYDLTSEYNGYNAKGFIGRLATSTINDFCIGGSEKLAYGLLPDIKDMDITYNNTINHNMFSFNRYFSNLTYNYYYANVYRSNKKYNNIQFNREKWNNKSQESKCIYGLFKTQNDSNASFMFISNNDNVMYSLDIDNYDQELIITKVTSSNGIARGVGSTSSTGLYIDYDKWNLLGLELRENKIIVYCNGNSYEDDIDNINLNLFYKIGIGYGYLGVENQTDYDNNIYTLDECDNPLNVLYFSIGTSFINDHKKIYSECNEYLNNNFKIEKTSKVTYYNKSIHENNSINIISLNGSTISSNNIKPYIESSSSENFIDNKSKMYEYDNVTLKHVYGSYEATFENKTLVNPVLGYKLVYGSSLLTGSTGTISVMIKPDDITSLNRRYIFSLIYKNNNINYIKLGLYINSSNKLIVESTSNVGLVTSYTLNHDLELDKWSYVSLAWSENDTVYIKYNTSNFISTNLTVEKINSCITYIGSTLNSNNECQYPLNGLMQMLSYSTNILTKEEVDEIYSNGLIEIKKTYDLDEKVISKKYITNENTLTNEYTYFNANNFSPNVQKEIDLSGNTITYTYDTYNNITSKTTVNSNNIILEKNLYKYDNVYRLIEETRYKYGNLLDYIYTYEYDTNGNITTKKKYSNLNILEYTDTYNYDTEIPDRLINVTRSENNVSRTKYEMQYASYVYPITIYKDNIAIAIEWSGNKISKIGNYYSKYDENGQRISFLNSNGLGKKYYYDGNNIIVSERITSTKIEKTLYHYDEINQLVGFNYDNNEYYYVRDITGNINKIVDTTGKVMVEYTYTAYGKSTVLVNNSLSEDEKIIANNIIDNNIFRYKGYCYDTEVELYWLTTRYYSPELCRFISPDSVEYLDPKSINGLNLYCYCLNNPVSYYDPSGHSIIGAMIFGAVIGFLSVYIPDVIDNLNDGFELQDLWTFKEDNLLEYLVNILGGALTGFIGELGINFLISAPLIGIINTGVSYLSGDVKTWQQGLDYFLQSTIIAGLTLGSKNLSNKIPGFAKIADLDTPLNNFIGNTIEVIEKALYFLGQSADNATEILILIFGVRKAWKDLNSH